MRNGNSIATLESELDRQTQGGPVRHARATVLVVDDDPAIAAAYELVLTREGYRVHVAATAAEACRFAEAPPHVIVLDLNLPGCDGLPLVGPLQAIAPGAAVVIVSGYIDDEMRAAAADAGVAACLCKPVHPNVLTSCVADIVGDHDLSDHIA